MANGTDPNPLGDTLSGSTLFAEVFMYEYVEWMWSEFTVGLLQRYIT